MQRAHISALLLLAGILTATPCVRAAEPDDDFEAMRAEMARELSDFRGEVGSDLRQFRDERDQAFAEFLKEQWEAFTELAGLIADTTPKPRSIPKAVERPADSSVLPQGKTVKVPPPAPVQPSPAALPATPVTPSTIPAPKPAPVVAPTAPPSPPPAAPLAAPAPAPVPKPAPVATPNVAPAPQPAPVLTPLATPQAPPVPLATPRPAPTSPPRPAPSTAPVPIPSKQPVARFEFYGTPLSLTYDQALRTSVAKPLSNAAISAVWTTYSTADFLPLLEQLAGVRRQLRLNDWGYYQLLQTLAEKIQTNANDADLFTWFLLVKSGYQCKVGYGGESIFLLAPAQPVIYEVPYFSIDGIRYFNLSVLRGRQSPGQIMTYGDSYPGAERSVGLGLEVTPNIPREPFNRQLRFSYAGKDYQLNVSGSRHTVRFLEGYPQTDFKVLFDASVSSEVDDALVEVLRPLVEGKSESEAVNLLLRFCQTAFSYKTDDDQFGKEKYLFVEETLFFPYSDCEDRSILFSYLVRRLTGLDVVGLHFPGHIATAVHFSGSVPGDSVQVDGQRFVVCDPTYINANIGMAMPQFRSARPEIIRIRM